MNDILYMKEAFAWAQKAFNLNEVPIGCVVVKNDEIIGRGYNRRMSEKNVLFHAEMIAINEACGAVGDWRLDKCRLYVTVEPCAMCAGAILQARVPVVVYGAKNAKAGCVGSIYNLLDDSRFNHRAEIVSGVLEDECAALMREFFKNFRD